VVNGKSITLNKGEYTMSELDEGMSRVDELLEDVKILSASRERWKMAAETATDTLINVNTVFDSLQIENDAQTKIISEYRANDYCETIRRLEDKNAELMEALEEIVDLCDDAMGEWLPVDTVYLPENMLDFRTIARTATIVLAKVRK
jgi:hypothetical protein